MRPHAFSFPLSLLPTLSICRLDYDRAVAEICAPMVSTYRMLLAYVADVEGFEGSIPGAFQTSNSCPLFQQLLRGGGDSAVSQLWYACHIVRDLTRIQRGILLPDVRMSGSKVGREGELMREVREAASGMAGQKGISKGIYKSIKVGKRKKRSV